MVKFQKLSCNFGAAPRRTAERQDFVELGAFELANKLSIRQWETREIKSYLLSSRAKVDLTIRFLKK
jgi:hypothetical protein